MVTNHGYVGYLVAVNPDFWNGLTDEEKRVIEYAAQSAIVAGRGLGRVIEASDRGLPVLMKEMQVNALTAEEKKKFQEAAMPAVKKLIVDKFGAEGEEMMNAFLDAVEQASK